MSPRRRVLEAQVEGGMAAGAASAIPTAILLGIGGVITGYGFWTPFYSIISILAPGALEQALDAHDRGNEVTFLHQPFVTGLALCFVLGAFSGAIFMVGVRDRIITGPFRLLLGALHGIFMMCVFYLGAQQALGAALNVEADAMSLALTAGWPMLVAAHAVHGIVVAWISNTSVIRSRQMFGVPAREPTKPT